VGVYQEKSLGKVPSPWMGEGQDGGEPPPSILSHQERGS